MPCLSIVELVEVAEGVLEPSDHLGSHPDRFLFKNCSRNIFGKDSLLALHLEVDFGGVVKVLEVEIMT